MMPFACGCEKEVAEMLRCGQWPQASPAELRGHVAGCRSCSDLVLLMGSFQAARLTAMDEPQLVSPGALWWRAQLRRRNAALERVARPILGAQIFALVLALLAAAGTVAWQVRAGVHPTAWLAGLARAFDFSALVPSAPFEGSLWWLVPLLASLALASGVVVYLASEKQ